MNIQAFRIMMGGDPEFFFAKDGETVGAEKVIKAKKNNIKNPNRLIIDGVQAEFNVAPSACRQSLARSYQNAFMQLAEALGSSGAKAQFKTTVTVSSKELSTLDKRNQQFGCDPSENVHGEAKLHVTDASKIRERTAGGHIHLGHYADTDTAILNNPEMLVPLLDILVGNTCVLLDTDSSNAKRRLLYGRAGEYRTPPHGIEYRTLSNFWLQHYILMSFVYGMARFAVNVASMPTLVQQFRSAVTMENVRKAINQNDVELAKHNFDAIKSIMAGLHAYGGSVYVTSYPLEGPQRIAAFEKLAAEGIENVLPLTDPLATWLHPYVMDTGWESFIEFYGKEGKKPKDISTPVGILQDTIPTYASAAPAF